MWTPLFLLVGLMGATAVIAYWSDNLGKKLGKKRVSLLGLRPKQTATLITIASSLVIMLVTFGTMLVVYKPLGDALLHYDRVRAQSVLLEKQNKTLESSNANFSTRNTLLSGDIERLQKQEETLRKNLQRVRDAKTEAEKGEQKASESAREAQKREREAKRGETVARRGAETARRSLEKLRRELEAARNELEIARDDLKTAQTDLKTAQANVKTAQANVKTAQTNVKTAQANLKTVQTNLKTAQTNLKTAQSAVKTVQEKVQKQGQEIITQQANLFDLELELEQRQQELDAANKDLKDKIAALSNAFNEPVIVAWGETLAQQFIAPRLNEESIANLLRDLMRQARANVQIIGVRTGRPSLQTNIIETSGADETAKINFIASELASRPTAHVVRVFAVRNHTAGDEAIDAEFNVLPVDNAYRRDAIIATSVIDGSLGDAQVFNQLLRLLNEGERLARTEKRVIPPQGGDNKFYAEGTNERLFEALRAITSLKSSARVRLRAAEDVTTTAPLKVRFEVLPAS